MEKIKKDVTVVGGANVDIGGKPDKQLIMRDSNPGTVQTSLGGVGRNIAHNLALLGNSVRFISAIGEDAHARQILEGCRELMIDTDSCLRTEEAPTSTYIYITNQKGDMEAAISDMRIAEYLTPEFIQSKMDVIHQSSLLVIDTNLPEETVHTLAKRTRLPVFAETVSRAKAEKLRAVLPYLHAITPNALEAEILSGRKVNPDKESSVAKAADVLLARGVRQVVITLGERGAYFADGESRGFVRSIPCNPVSVNGAGDALIAGLVTGFLKQLPLSESVRLGAAAAAFTLEATAANYPELTLQKVAERANVTVL